MTRLNMEVAMGKVFSARMWELARSAVLERREVADLGRVGLVEQRADPEDAGVHVCQRELHRRA